MGKTMITKRDIVDRAFKLLSMSGFELDDSPEDEQDILQALDDMMAELQTDNYDFGYLFSDDVTESYLGDLAGIKRDALAALLISSHYASVACLERRRQCCYLIKLTTLTTHY